MNTNSLVLPQTPKAYKYQLTNANNLAAETVGAGATAGTKIMGILASSSDTTARDVQLTVLRSAVNYPLVTVTVPINAGSIAATAPIDMLSFIPGLPIDQFGNHFLFLESTDTLQVQTLVQITSGKFIFIQTVAADFA